MKGRGVLSVVVRVPKHAWQRRCWAVGAAGRGCVQNRRRGYLTCGGHAALERYARADYFAGPWPDAEGVRRPRAGECRGCGCTDDQACAFGCTWVDHGLCSACVPPEELGPLERLAYTRGERKTGSHAGARRAAAR